eukprot:jgi/Mesvir1/21780/Mv26177-RA.1
MHAWVCGEAGMHAWVCGGAGMHVWVCGGDGMHAWVLGGGWHACVGVGGSWHACVDVWGAGMHAWVWGEAGMHAWVYGGAGMHAWVWGGMTMVENVILREHSPWEVDAQVAVKGGTITERVLSTITLAPAHTVATLLVSPSVNRSSISLKSVNTRLTFVAFPLKLPWHLPCG